MFASTSFYTDTFVESGMRSLRSTVGVAAAVAAVHLVAASLPAVWMPALPSVGGDPEPAFRVLSAASNVAFWGSATLLVVVAAFWAARRYGSAGYAATAVSYAVAGGAATAGAQWIGYAASTVTPESGPVDPWFVAVVAGLFAASAVLGTKLTDGSGGRGGGVDPASP